MTYTLVNAPAVAALPCSLRCPSCRREGTFEPVTQQDVREDSHAVLGIRRCPNPECRAAVFLVLRSHGAQRPIESYPAELLEFDPAGIPERVVAALEEALQDHAHGCFVSSALMVRKTLEELCADQGATGKNLADRIDALAETVVLPKGFKDGIHNLRLLGNDAAHVEARDYDEIGKEEVEISIEVTQTLLRATYQQQGLLDRLESLKAGEA